MQFSTLTLAALATLASAETVHVVKVGLNSSLTYEPNDFTAAVGDMVQFQFFGGNHTATQSTFDNPCQPVSQFTNNTGFHTGFIPAAASEAMGMRAVYTIRINNTNPLWIYCAQGRHCESGMAMVINKPVANTSRTLQAYKDAAKNVAQTVLPDGGSTGGTPGSTDSNNPGAADPNANSDGVTAGAGMLSASYTSFVLAAAGLAAFLL